MATGTLFDSQDQKATPSDGTFVQGVSAVITTTTAVEVLAAPDAGRHLVITRVVAVNITPAEDMSLMLLDSTPANLCPLGINNAADISTPSQNEMVFKNGLVCASAKAFQAKGNVATTGDAFVYAEGYSIAD